MRVSGETETADKHCGCLWNEGLWRCDDELVSKAEATKWWEAEEIPLLFITEKRQDVNYLLDLLLAF